MTRSVRAPYWCWCWCRCAGRGCWGRAGGRAAAPRRPTGWRPPPSPGPRAAPRTPRWPQSAAIILHFPTVPVLSQCCSEFGYCHGRAAWARAQFRDCNGRSNGAALPPAVLAAELREREMGRLAADDQLLGDAAGFRGSRAYDHRITFCRY